MEKSNAKQSVVSVIEENVIYPIYSAVMSLKIDLPLPDVVEGKFRKIKHKKNFYYCITLLGRIKAIVDNPAILVDSFGPLDVSTQMPEDELEYCLTSAFHISKELLESFPSTFSLQALQFCREAMSPEGRLKLRAYKEYFRTLYVRLLPMAAEFGLHFDESFSAVEKIFVKHSPAVLMAVHDFLVEEGCLYADTDTRDAFLAIFKNMGMIQQGYRIKWIKPSVTTGETNMYSLYITFEELGVCLENKRIRSIVEGKFIGRTGEPIVLKKRESKRAELFRERLRNVIQTNS